MGCYNLLPVMGSVWLRDGKRVAPASVSTVMGCYNLLPVMGSVRLRDGKRVAAANCVDRDGLLQFTTRDGIRLAA